MSSTKDLIENREFLNSWNTLAVASSLAGDLLGTTLLFNPAITALKVSLSLTYDLLRLCLGCRNSPLALPVL